MPITLTIGNQSVTVPDASSMLEVVYAAGTYSHQLCKGPYMNPNTVSNTKSEPLE